MIVALYSFLSLISVSQAKTPTNSAALHNIAAHVRVGNAKTALALLKRHKTTSGESAEQKTVRQLLEAQSHLLLAQPSEAIKELEKVPTSSALQPIT